MWYLDDPGPRENYNILATQTQMRCKIQSFTPFRVKYRHKKRNRNGHVCIHYGICYGISHVILRSDMKMQRKIAERCIRYFTKIGLSPASTTTLPLLDTKNVEPTIS